MTVAVERATSAGRVGLLIASLLVAGLIALPWAGDAGLMRMVVELIALLVLA